MLTMILRLAGPHRNRLLAGVALRMLDGALALLPVLVLFLALREIVTPGTPGVGDGGAGWTPLRAGLCMAGIVALRFIVHGASVRVGHMAGFHILKRLRLHYAEHLRGLPVSWFSRRDLGEVSGALLQDLGNVEPVLVEKLAAMGSAVTQIAVGLACIAVVDWRLALLVCCGFVPAALLMWWVNGRLRRRMPERIRVLAALTSRTVEFCQGIGVVKAFGIQGKSTALYERAVAAHRDVNLGLLRYVGAAATLYFTCLELGYAGLIGFGLPVPGGVPGDVTVSGAGGVDPAAFAAFLFAAVMAFRIYGPTHDLVDLSGFMHQMRTSGRSLLSVEADGPLPVPAVSAVPADSSVRFENVAFAYDGTPVLRDITFSIAPRTMTAVVGGSGAGKTTLVSLLCRFWDVDAGCVRIGGVDVRDMREEDLWRHITVVFQRFSLFNDTVRANIRFARPDATDDEVVAAAVAARCHEFIMELPDGYDTVIGENGASLSGGQRQRLSIARAMLKNAPIVVLDEATASVDLDNERLIQEAIQNMVQSKTVLLIAHRLATVAAAHQILVLDEGRIVDSGTHAGLLAGGGQYARLWDMQSTVRSWNPPSPPSPPSPQDPPNPQDPSEQVGGASRQAFGDVPMSK